MINHKFSISPANSSEWKKNCLECPYATFFHTPEWYATAVQFLYKDYSPVAELITFKDNKSALLIYLKKTRLLGLHTAISTSPFSTYGGWLSNDHLSPMQIKVLLKVLFKKGSVTFRENPLDNQLLQIELPFSQYDFTSIIDLTKSVEELHASSSNAHHKALLKAEREGIIVEAVETIEEWKSYYEIYEDSLQRWKKGGPEKATRIVYNWDLFKAIFEMKSNRKLWVAKKDNAIIAGILCFYFNKHAVAWHGAALSSYFNLRPNNMLYWKAMLNAKDEGYNWFDCNPSGNYKGVIEFKEHLGCQPLQSRVVQHYTPFYKMLYRFRSLFK